MDNKKRKAGTRCVTTLPPDTEETSFHANGFTAVHLQTYYNPNFAAWQGVGGHVLCIAAVWVWDNTPYSRCFFVVFAV